VTGTTLLYESAPTKHFDEAECVCERVRPLGIARKWSVKDVPLFVATQSSAVQLAEKNISLQGVRLCDISLLPFCNSTLYLQSVCEFYNCIPHFETMTVAAIVGISAACLLFVLASAAKPPMVNIGGMFAPIDSTGAMSLSQAEHLAAFVMAINEINDKTDGIYDDLLPSTHLSIGVRGSTELPAAMDGFSELRESFSGEGVFSVVNALPSAEALLINQVSAAAKVAQIISVANSAEFFIHEDYPYVSRTLAVQAYESVVLSELLCSYFKARKIVTISNTQDEDIIAALEFVQLAGCEFDTLAAITVFPGQTDFTNEINEALKSGSRYFVLFMPPTQLASLLEQGHEAGLFEDNAVVLASSRGSDNITGSFSPGADVPALMKGFFSLTYWPNVEMNQTVEAIQFAMRWRAQASTAGKTVAGNMVCDETMDDDGGFYLYRNQKIGSSGNGTICTGIDFSSYSVTGLDIQPYTPLTYDATMVMAMALHVAIENGLDYEDPEVLMSLQISNVSYTGASGSIAIRPGIASHSFNGRGGRSVGNYYNVTNFNTEEYLAGRNPLVNIGFYNGDEKSFNYCVIDDVTCFAAEFSDAVGGDYSIPPTDTPPPIFRQMSAGFMAALYLLGAILSLLVVVFVAFIVMHRGSKLIKSSQPVLLYSILVGGLTAALRVFIGGTVKNDILCMCQFWSGHLAFVLVIGSLFVKGYRVHCIVNTKTLRRVKFTAGDAMKILSSIVGCTIIYLIIASAFGQPHMQHHTSVLSNQETIEESCAMEIPEFQTALFAAEFVLLMIAFWVCWETRNVPDVVNESKVISTGKPIAVIFSVVLADDIAVVCILQPCLRSF
jgi:ABC-type branched-subunit amino acid transport system substrate-binding protein